MQGVAFEFSPADSMSFYAAAYGSPYVVWLESAAEHIEDIRRQVTRCWKARRVGGGGVVRLTALSGTPGAGLSQRDSPIGRSPRLWVWR